MKTEIIKTIELCLNQAKTRKEFLELLQQNNLHYYERKHGEVTGIVFENDKYRFTRLGIDLEKLHSLPLDLTEEQKTLKEIEAIRNRREEPVRNRVLRFEENGVIKTVTYDNELKETSWKDLDGQEQEEESRLTVDEKEELDKYFDFAQMDEEEIHIDEIENDPYNLDDF